MIRFLTSLYPNLKIDMSNEHPMDDEKDIEILVDLLFPQAAIRHQVQHYGNDDK